jgi:uncharacterized protein involved in exopolysaccharide biosynthesis
VNGAGVKLRPDELEILEPRLEGETTFGERESAMVADHQARLLRLLWNSRRLILRASATGFLASTLIAFLIPSSYTAEVQLMPPDTESAPGLALMAGLAAKAGGGVGSMAGDLLGLKSSGALFMGVLRSQTAQDRLIQQFGLQKVYRTKLITDARKQLDQRTAIAEDRKSGIISISVNDHDPKRAAALADGYVNQLNTLVTELSTSAAHREGVFLAERLKVAQTDLDAASNRFAQFSSQNSTLDIQTEGKAMLDAAGTLAGQMMVAESELEGLRQIYTDNNPRVRALNARVVELRSQLGKLAGAAPETSKAANLAPQASNGMPYPTIRSLPLLGAKYADLYRRAKIQETVFELLTEQYELAKVEEAKETPSVKVLDPARIPEKKSSTSRLLMIFLGSLLVFSLSVVWVLGRERWRAVEADDPRKLLALEVWAAMTARLRTLRNGVRPRAKQNSVASSDCTEHLERPDGSDCPDAEPLR